jgi:hypothetical protein
VTSIQPWLFLAVAVVMGWFAAGVIGNIRRGNAALKWMQGGLPRLGARTSLRWLGSSVVELGIAKAHAPFRQVQILLVLAPRDVPWLWLWSRLSQRKDTLILRCLLHAAPRLEYEITAPHSWTGRRAVAEAEARRWQQEDLPDLRFLAPRPSFPVSRRDADAVLQSAHQVHSEIWRLAVRRQYPHLELHIPLPDPGRHAAPEFFEAVRRLARQVAAAPGAP